MTPPQREAALQTAITTITALLTNAPDYGSIGADFFLKNGVLIRTTTRTEKIALAEGVQNGR